MKCKADRIIALSSSLIFVFLGFYTALIAHAEIVSGTTIQQFVVPGIVLSGVLSMTLFSIFITINYFRSKRMISQGNHFLL